MKPFLIWLALAAAGFGGLGGGYHAYLAEHPRRVAVVVDTSFPMQPVWSRVPALLEGLEDRRYTEFALLTDRSVVHGWSQDLRLGRLSPYGPRDLAGLAARRDAGLLGEADRVYLITNAGGDALDPFSGWRVLRPGG